MLFALCSGCLTVETKEYQFKIKKDKSGEATVKYINIMSDNKDSAGIPEEDYGTLINSYLNGQKLQEDFPGAKNMKKRLYEEDNRLCGEVKFEFDDITNLKFYKYKAAAPWCYYLGGSMSFMGSFSESYFSSNGVFGGENMPVIFWDSNQKIFEFKTTITPPSKNTLSLLELWKQKGEK
ncbi:MAG: hypothetical protein ACRDFC_10235 [Ignavibacteria bacterium]